MNIGEEGFRWESVVRAEAAAIVQVQVVVATVELVQGLDIAEKAG